MSAPTTHDPRFVNTRDGVCWERRTVTDSGLGLYAVEGSCKCPPFKMATLAELAEHGIVGSADVLPVPVGPQPVSLSGPICSQLEARAAGLDVAPSVEELDAMAESVVALGDPLSAEVALAQAVPLLGAAVTGLRAQVAALLEERHSTNESVSGAAEALRVQRDRIAELEAGIAWRDAERDRWSGVHYVVKKAIDKGWNSVDTWELEDALGPEPAPAPAEPVVEPACPCPPADQPGPHQLGCPQAEVPVAAPAERPVNGLTATFMPVATYREGLEDPHDGPLAHRYLLGHDLPQMGGAE